MGIGGAQAEIAEREADFKRAERELSRALEELQGLRSLVEVSPHALLIDVEGAIRLNHSLGALNDVPQPLTLTCLTCLVRSRTRR